MKHRILALTLALRSYADQLACQRVLELIGRRTPLAGQAEKRRRKTGRETAGE